MTALALLDHVVVVAARGGPGEELWLVERGTNQKVMLRGGHDFDLRVDVTFSAIAIGYVPQSGVFTSLDVGRPVFPD